MSIPTPFFATKGTAAPRGRLLLLSWHFPPGQSAGALRWQKMARYVAERGYGLDVIAADPAMLSATDEKRLEELPPGTRVYGVRTPPTFLASVDAWRTQRNSAKNLASSGRAATGLKMGQAQSPAAYRPSQLARVWNALLHFGVDRAWARQAGDVAERLLSKDHKAIITCGPPHMIHAIGMSVAARRGVPGVMDMRDPWAARRRVPDSLDTPLWFWLADHNQARAVSRACMVVANTQALAASIRATHSSANVISVMNGYDEEQIPQVARGDRFVLAYAGAIYIDRDPGPLFRAVVLAARRLGVGPERLGVELVGRVTQFGGRGLESIAAENGASGFVRLSPPVPRSDALRFLAGAQMLVSLPQDSHFAIPSKIFEYMSYNAWILAMASPGSPTAELLRGTPADVVSPDDVEGMARVIESRARAYWSGIAPPRLADDARFGRRHQAGLLLDALELLTESRS